MSELALLDFNNFSLDRFKKVQVILTSGSTVVPRTKPDRYEFARKVVNLTLTTLEEWKIDTKRCSTTERKYVHETASLAFRALYEQQNGRKPTKGVDVEKRHVSFALKLIDAGMIEAAVTELKEFEQRIMGRLDWVDFALASLEGLLRIPIPSKEKLDEALVGVIVIAQIALLKALSKYPKGSSKPISNAVSTFSKTL